MFNGTNNYSLADLAAVNGNNDGFGGNNGWAWFLIIILLFAGWGTGNRGGLFGGSDSTASGVTDGYILTSDFANIERKLDSVNNGICSLGYDQLGQMNNINQNINNQGAAIQNSITQQTINDMQNVNALGTQITALGTQMASCCCDQRYETATQFANLGYNLADQSCQTRRALTDSTAAIIANQDANTRNVLQAIQDMQTNALQDKINALTADNQALKFAASQQAQNAYLVQALGQQVPVAAYTVPNPYTGQYNNYGCACTGCNC